MNEIINFAVNAALRGGEIAREYRKSGEINLRKKSELDLLTAADLAVNDAIQRMIRDQFPDHAILSEETEPEREINWQKPLWIIDPIDGTTNFAHGHLHVGVSIAFVDRRTVQAGVVYAPFLNELYKATKGAGATCNDQKISASKCTRLKDALVATGFPYQRDDLTQIVRRVNLVLRECRDLRRLGACSLDICYVACGKLDAYYESVRIWDMAAASLIAREAGAAIGRLSEPEAAGGVTDEIPEEFYSRDLVVCADGIKEAFIKLLR